MLRGIVVKRFLIAAIMFLGIGIIGYQQEVAASEFNFSVHFDLPENQVDKNKTYLDLLVKPEQKQEITYTLRNDTQKDVLVDISVHSATTNSNGVIEYGESLSKKDETLSYDLADLLTIDKQVKVPANSSVQKKLVIQTPAEQVAGIIAGGITFKERTTETPKAQQDKVGVVNVFSQVKAVLLQMSEEKVTPELNLIKAGPKQSNVRNIIAVNLQNTQAAYMFDMAAAVKIYRGSEKEPVLSLNKEGINMAPNTNFDLPVALKGQPLEAGKYRVEVDACWQEKQWHLQSEFTVSKQEAISLNDTDIDRAAMQTSPNYWMWGTIGLTILILIILGMFIYKKISSNRGEK
jgi:hypothetical protein